MNDTTTLNTVIISADADLVMIRDALDILNPDEPAEMDRRDTLFAIADRAVEARHTIALPAPSDVRAAAEEMLGLMVDALSAHIYSYEDGERPAADCEFVASINRVAAALGLPAPDIETAAPAAAPLCQHCGDDLTSNPCANCNGFNEPASTWWHVSANYYTASGNAGHWSRDIEVMAGQDVMALADAAVRKARNVVRGLDMSAQRYPAGYTPSDGEQA